MTAHLTACEPKLAALRAAALQVLLTANAADKAALAQSVPVSATVDPTTRPPSKPGLSLPARPSKPQMVPHTQVPTGSVGTKEGKAKLIHALAHIEFNAIDLAADAVWRFDGMPPDYYRDWAQVMREEALHFQLLQGHLQTLGYTYGNFPAHNSLWDMAERTAHDVLARMAVVPRTLEARGLDASPSVRNKLNSVGDHAAAAIIDVILRDEIGHVSIGNRWYRWLCQQRGLDESTTWRDLCAKHDAPKPRGPFNLSARRAAGFGDDELAELANAQRTANTP